LQAHLIVADQDSLAKRRRVIAVECCTLRGFNEWQADPLKSRILLIICTAASTYEVSK
jgi:hypothetical protein